MSDWHPYDGDSVGSEGGRVVRDEEHSEGARVTLELIEDQGYVITSGVYGLMVHTAFLPPKLSDIEAEAQFESLRQDVEGLLEPDGDVGAFVERWYG